MRADELVGQLGDGLIGRRVNTIAIGDYPGGIAEVTQILPDPDATEIVFQVLHPTFGTIGVFQDEPVFLVP